MKTTIDPHTIVDMQTTKALTHEQNDRLREVLRAIVKEHGGVVSRAAKEIGISHSLVFEMLAGQRGGGTKVLQRLSAYTGRTVDDLLGYSTVREPSDHREGDELQHHPLWNSSIEEFRESAAYRGDTLNDDVIAEMATTSFSRSYATLTVTSLRRLYEALAQLRDDNRPKAAGTSASGTPAENPAQGAVRAARK